MAGEYLFPLLVELEENNIPKLKNKLVKYFQSRKSNGGDCEVDYENGSRTATLRFRREEDQRNVLKKESHEISVDTQVLRMKVRLATEEKTTQEALPDPVQKKLDAATDNKPSGATAEVVTKANGKDDDTPDEELCSNIAILGNIDKLNQEFLEMLVENILKGPDSTYVSQSFTLEIIPHMSSAVVSFQTGKENAEFVTRCHENRTFKKKQLSVRPLEVTDQVLAEDIKNLSEDILRLVFENADVDVENIVLNQVEQSAIITFKDHKAVQKILKKKHCFKDEEIKVYPFYKSFGTALYGKDKPSLKPPASISETIDESLWRYLNRNQSAAAAIRNDLAKHFCKVDFSQSSVCLNPESSILQQKDAKAIVNAWEDNVKSAFTQAMSKFKSLTLHTEPEAWQESEDKIRQMSEKENLVVMPDKARGVLSVAGPVDRVNKLEKTFSEVLDTIAKRVHREKSSLTDNITMSPSTFHLLHQGGLKEKLLHVYPELKMSFVKNSSVLAVTGLKDEILAATKVIYDARLALKHQYIEIDNFLLDLLKDEEQEELSKVLLISQGVNAAFEMASRGVQLLAVSDRDLKNAEDHLGNVLISEFIDVEDGSVLKKPEWQHLVSGLESGNRETWRKIRIQTAGQQVVVSGLRQNVIKVSDELKDFLTQNAQVEEVVPANSSAIVEYIKPEVSNLKQLKDKVDVSYSEDSICLSGSRADVADCKSLVEDLVSSVIFENFKVAKPGVRKLFKDKQSMYTASLLKDTSCVVQLVDGEAGVGPDDLANRSKPVYQLQTGDGVDIAVCKADMCSYPVHAVVNSSNTTLKLDGGLASALLKAAGNQLQDQCDRVLKGQLSPGDCVITDAGGQLCCKKVIHAVGPQYDSKKHPKVVSLLKKAVKGSLELAEQNNCFSVALPAISRTQGFDLTLCASTIVKAVKEFCDEKYEDNSIKSIHFVDTDDTIVQAMEAAVRKEFGNHGVSHSQQSSQTKTKKLPHKRASTCGSDPNCLGQVQTKEGLDLTLMKGNIEKATTEVTVNTVFEDLNLSKGAVSSAIFREAGPNLQQLVKAKSASGTFGDIIVTGGANLKSKQVFHAVSPHWDKGKGATQKILSGIFKECLNKAEDTGLTSLSFPAIGTGNLGFPKDLVATLMLDEIVSFSSKKQPKNLKKVMIILYPGDASTIQVFSDVFKKTFPNASAGKMSANTPQSQGPFSKVVSNSGMHETKLGNVAIQVVTGDITKENTDVVVNSSNDSFSLKSGVSKAILDAAGQAVEAECQTLAAQPNQGMIMTQPGNLKCKKILHLVGQTDPVNIKKVVKDALQMCVKYTYTSVSFPAIGTGQGSVQAVQVADAMLDAVIEVLTQYTSSPLKTVRIVIFQPPMLKDFYNSMDQRSKKEETDTKGKKGLLGDITSRVKSWFTGGVEQRQEGEDGDFVIEPLKVDPVCFHICGNSQIDVDSAKTWINNLISSEIETNIISDKAILSFSKVEYDTIADIQKNSGVCIRVESKKGDASVTIEGLSKDVFNAYKKINKMMREATDKEELRRKIELASAVAEWQYQKQGLLYESFDATTNYHLEEALQNEQNTVTVTVNGQNYTVTMPKGPATDSQGRTLQIKRIDKLQAEDIPGHWDPMSGSSFCKVNINAGTGEYNEVLNLFKASCNRTVLKIERIQNLGMWKGLMVKKYDMEQRNGHQNNLRRLFHGTCHTSVDWINKNGFNRSYAGKNAACYGNGTYFAVNANYSAADAYSRPNSSGEKFMYLCQVLTGDFTPGRQGMNAPPEKTAGSYQLYDSLVDRMPTPSMFIIFHDAQAYPEYLITFK